MLINVDGTLHLGKPGSKLFLPCGSIVHFTITGNLTIGPKGGGSSREVTICGVKWWISSTGSVSGILTWGVIAPLASNSYQFYISETEGNPTINLFIDDESITKEIKIFKAVNSYDFEVIETFNSKSQINYTDENLDTGISYYKIGLVNENGIQETVILSFERKETALFYPNPARDVLNINIDNERTYKAVKIFSVTGELVHQTTNKINSVDVSDWNSGIYLIQIEHENNITTNRLVVQ